MTRFQRARIVDIARHAKVGTATVDRVLNDRPHVSPATRRRVLHAISELESDFAEVAPSRQWRLQVLLPADAGPSTEFLAQCFGAIAAKRLVRIECEAIKKIEPEALAAKLGECVGRRVDAVAFQALDDPRVRDAVSKLAQAKIPSLALLSGLENSGVIGRIGIDNRAAGRTAGYIMGRMLPQSGLVAVVTGSLLYSLHEDRETGFRSMLRRQFPHLRTVGVCSGYDDIEGNYRAVGELMRHHPELAGIYNVGGGNEGIVRALQDHPNNALLYIGHNLTHKTQGYLLSGAMDIILHQNMRRIAKQAVAAIVARLEGQPVTIETLPTEIITRENLLGAVFE
ncbi:MAG: LacI family DNA-binding transcriptional regulator [Rhodobacteraceae bacterium]|nr:LacI family DNA-binding transcriptional regulator [Paracoccaceae bacterium]